MVYDIIVESGHQDKINEPIAEITAVAPTKAIAQEAATAGFQEIRRLEPEAKAAPEPIGLGGGASVPVAFRLWARW